MKYFAAIALAILTIELDMMVSANPGVCEWTGIALIGSPKLKSSNTPNTLEECRDECENLEHCGSYTWDTKKDKCELNKKVTHEHKLDTIYGVIDCSGCNPLGSSCTDSSECMAADPYAICYNETGTCVGCNLLNNCSINATCSNTMQCADNLVCDFSPLPLGKCTDSWVDMSNATDNGMVKQGCVSSPNYPADYENDIAHTFTITVDVGKRISGIFSDFATECCCDEVFLYDGPTSSDPEIVQLKGENICCSRFPGNTVYTSTGNQMHVRFTPDFSIVKRGFVFCYTEI